METFIPRKLAYAVGSNVRSISHEALLELGTNIILLGEAGGGKTRLTEWLGDVDGYVRCTARQLVNGIPRNLFGDADIIVIDALDELATKAEGDAVDAVLRALREIDFPRFILSCRTSEWRASTMREAIREQYSQAPIELELVPLTDDDALRYLASFLEDGERAKVIVRHFRERGLTDWLGNPQTLAMIGDVSRSADLPETAFALFERYVDLAWHEHNDRRLGAPLQKLGKDAVLDSLGAGFAAIVLTGSAALSDEPRHKLVAGDLPLADLTTLPQGKHLDAALASRLCVGRAERRTFQHKRLGEYLGARWIVKQANTPAKRGRVLAMMRSNGIVPSNLRGLHAWLAMYPHFADDVIRADPAGVIEYGDADDLPEGRGRVLLEALAALVASNPLFNAGWNPRAGSLVKGDLLDESWRILNERTDDGAEWRYPFALRIVIARQLSNPMVVRSRVSQIKDILLDPRHEFAIRAAAGKALARFGELSDWAGLLDKLRGQGHSSACRLAVDLLDDIEFRGVSDRQIVELVLAYDGITLCPVPQAPKERHTVGTLFHVEHELPDDRIDGLLDEFAEYLQALTDNLSWSTKNFDLRSLIGGLVLRRLEFTDDRPLLEPSCLWRWLRPLGGDRGYSRTKRDLVTEWLLAHDGERRAIQRYVLLEMEDNKDLWQRYWELHDALPGAALNSIDLSVLLEGLDVTDDRWRDLLTMIRHEGETGAEARTSAKRFVTNRMDMLRWIDDLATPRKAEWQERDEARERKRKAKEALRNAEHRAAFLSERDQLLSGDIGSEPAQAYLGHFTDLSKERPPHERIGEWLGDDLQADALAGFEAYLTRSPADLTAEEIAENWAEGSYWPIIWVLVAALMERLRHGKGFKDLPDDRLISAMLQIEHGLTRSEEARELGDALEFELRERGAYERYVRLLIEPYLRHRRTVVTGLYGLMRDSQPDDFATRLAAEWLQSFPQMAADAEEEMIDCLIRAHDKDTLRVLSVERAWDEQRDDRSRRNWQAVALWTGFDATEARMADEGSPDPSLLWTLRDRFSGGRHADGTAVAISTRMTAWIIRIFRACWSWRDHPIGVRSGDKNAWDASEYLIRLMGRLGDDLSGEALQLLTELRDAPPDGYTSYLQQVATEQEVKRAEAAYSPPAIADIANALTGSLPSTHAALQSEVIDALQRVQARVRSDPTDCWRGFFRDNKATPKHEEECSDHLAVLLQAEAPEIAFDPEFHVGGNREVDIACSVGNLRIPIEAKGQWNKDLWSAAQWQLGDQQAVDHKANGCGVYLVYWFGSNGKSLAKSPAGVLRPTTPDDLQYLLSQMLTAAGRHNLKVVVLDLVRPAQMQV